MDRTNNISDNLNKLESNIQDLIMLEDSARGTMCAIHSTIQSTENFPYVPHQIVNVCPMSSRIAVENRPKKRMCNISPGRGVLRQNNQIKGVIRRNCPCLDVSQHQMRLMPLANNVNIGKTPSCPGKMCCCRSNGTFARSSSVKSRSTVEFYTDQNTPDASSIVKELKCELQKVQHHLQHIASLQNASVAEDPLKGTNEDSIDTLKEENKRLKRELDNKKKLLNVAKKDVENAKSILTDYEKKVSLLHEQALKSSKVMTESKEKFCKCLKSKELKIQELARCNDDLQNSVKEKDKEVDELTKRCECLKSSLDDMYRQSDVLSESNQGYNKCIRTLESDLDCARSLCKEYQECNLALEKRVQELNCKCQKMRNASKRQRTALQGQSKQNIEMKDELKKQLTFLTQKLSEKHNENNSLIEYKRKYNDIKKQLEEYEECSTKCKLLEETCKQQLETALENERYFLRQMDEMQGLVYELTDVVKQNKVSLLKISQVNKEQEALIQTQSAALITKANELQRMQDESELLRSRSETLEKEVGELRCMLECSGPCTKDTCVYVAKQLDEIRLALAAETEKQMFKEKIIEDQSHTISSLQMRIKDTSLQLDQTLQDADSLKKEIWRMNSELDEKHEVLSREVSEKETLMHRLKILEKQKNSLSEELSQLEILLRKYIATCKHSAKEQKAFTEIQLTIQKQKEEWNAQKELLAKEKQQAVDAAKFATKKLVETVADFQKQVESQKKVQLMLTRMLKEKDKQLQIVNQKISSISRLTDEDVPMEEIYRSKGFNVSNATITSSFHSTCSNCSKNMKNRRASYTKSDAQELFQLINGNRNELPSRDQ